MREKVELLLRTLDTFSKDLVVEDTKVTTLCFNNEEGKLLNNYIQELQHQLEEKEKVIDEALEYINQQIFDMAMFGNDTLSLGRLLEILERGKYENANN